MHTRTPTRTRFGLRSGYALATAEPPAATSPKGDIPHLAITARHSGRVAKWQPMLQKVEKSFGGFNLILYLCRVNQKQERMNEPTKKTWLDLTMVIADELEDLERKVRDAQKMAERRIEETKSMVDWDWEYTAAHGEVHAAIWDDATDDERAMLDYAARFNVLWPFVQAKIDDARQQLFDAYALLDLLKNK